MSILSSWYSSYDGPSTPKSSSPYNKSSSRYSCLPSLSSFLPSYFTSTSKPDPTNTEDEYQRRIAAARSDLQPDDLDSAFTLSRNEWSDTNTVGSGSRLGTGGSTGKSDKPSLPKISYWPSWLSLSVSPSTAKTKPKATTDANTNTNTHTQTPSSNPDPNPKSNVASASPDPEEDYSVFTDPSTIALSLIVAYAVLNDNSPLCVRGGGDPLTGGVELLYNWVGMPVCSVAMAGLGWAGRTAMSAWIGDAGGGEEGGGTEGG